MAGRSLPSGGGSLCRLSFQLCRLLPSSIFWATGQHSSGPLIVTNDPDIYTIPVGIASFNGEFQMDWEIVMTASCLATLPTLLVFLLLQKFIIRGIMLAGLKG